MKSKIPLGKKPKGEEESEDIEEETSAAHQSDATDATDISDLGDEDIQENAEPENKSLIYKIKSAFQKKSSGKAAAASEDDDSVAAAKKKKSKIIQIVIGVGVVLFLLSDEIFPPDTPEETAPEVKLKPRPRPNKKKTEGEGAEAPPAEAAANTPAEQIPPVKVQPPTETASEPADVTSTEVPPEDTSISEPTAETPPMESAPVDTAPVESSSFQTTEDFPEEQPPLISPSSDTEDTVDGNETTVPGEENITDQILEDLEKQAKSSKPLETKKEYVAPPDYEYRGRGLVYNCKGKHWACVDAPSYKTCEDNSSSVKFLNKKVECYPFNIYDTQKGCESMQNRMVTSAAKTGFCNE